MHKKSKIPSRKECLELIAKYEMPANIKEHSLIVCRIGLALAQELNKKQAKLNLSEIEAAALLHDITKSSSIKTKENHAESAAQLLRALHYDRIAEIVSQHISLSATAEGTRVTPEEIVFYADKRVRHNRVVSLNERFEDLMQRYGKDPAVKNRINKQKRRTQTVEKKIFAQLNFSADDLPELAAKDK